LVVEDYVPYLRTQLAARQVRAVASLRGKDEASKVALANPGDAPPTVDIALQGEVELAPEGAGIPPVPVDAPAYLWDDSLDNNDDLVDYVDEPELAEPADLSKREQLKIEATSVEHMRDHLPKNLYCSCCQQGKMLRRAHGKHTS